MAHQARIDAVKWAQDVLSKKDDVLIFDTESTGTRASSEIVDIAVVNGGGDVVFDSLVQPLNPIPLEATAIHGISNQDVAGAPFWPEIYAQLYKIFEEHTTVVVYNLDFDVRLFNQSSGQYGLRRLPFPSKTGYHWSCAMKRYGEYDGTWNARFGNYRWHRLSEATQRFGIETPPNLHRALADARLTLQLVEAMANDQESEAA